MTNPANVQFITEKLLDFLRGTTDSFLKKDLTTKVCRLAERYAPNNLWYVETVTELFTISGDFVSEEVSQQLMTLIAEGAGEEGDEDADTYLRQYSVTIYANLLDKPISKLPQLLIETMAWVLGEYAYLSEDCTLEEIIDKLCELVRKGKQLKESTRRTLITAVMKLIAQAGTCPPHAAKIIDDFTKAKDEDLQQRCIEFQNLITTIPHILGEVLPVDASCEDIQVDENLSFMNAFVRQAISNGAKEYEKPEDDDEEEDDYIASKTGKVSVFKMTPYEKPPQPGSSYNRSAMAGVGSNMSSTSMGAAGTNVTPPPGTYRTSQQNGLSNGTSSMANEPQLNVRNVANVWGKSGVSNGTKSSTAVSSSSPAPASLSTPAAPASNSTWSYTNTYTSQTAPAPVQVVKTEEQLRKERMAAALFGGSGSSAPSSVTRPSIPKRTEPRRITPSASESSVRGGVMPETDSTPPAAAPEVDLLDLMGDFEPAQISAVPDVDILAPSPLEDTQTKSSSTKEETPLVDHEDPFAASGLLGGLSDAPLSSLHSDRIFQHEGQSLAPLQITTEQFGAKWGSVPHTCPLSTISAKYVTLDAVMELFASVGLKNIESIPATSEGICGGMMNGSELILLHGKVTPSGSSAKVDMTIKSTDVKLGSCLSMYLQNLIR